jgi:hypothetical protein
VSAEITRLALDVLWDAGEPLGAAEIPGYIDINGSYGS